MATFKNILISCYHIIENTFKTKFLSCFEYTYNGATRPETQIYFHQILHSKFAVSEYDLYIVGCLYFIQGYLKLLLFPVSNCNSHFYFSKKCSNYQHYTICFFLCQLEVLDTLHIRELIVIVIILHFRYMRSGLVGKKKNNNLHVNNGRLRE